MGLETADTIWGLNPSNPAGSDDRAEGDNHLRLIKAALQDTFLVGTTAARPAAGTANRFYFSTDDKILYRDTGAAWVQFGVAAGDNISDLTNDAGYLTTSVNDSLTITAASPEFSMYNTSFAHKNFAIHVLGDDVRFREINDSGSTVGEWLIYNGSAERVHIGKPLIVPNDFALVGKTSKDIDQVGAYLTGENLESHITASGVTPFAINRQGTDGNLLNWYNDNTLVGAVSVSGTTVTYGGAHLGRWSQLPGRIRRDIPRGTVMTLLDEMCQWESEPNEQLTKAEVSSQLGDKNPAGVFDHWDDEEYEQDYGDVEDFFIATSGDFLIRVRGSGELGDLLESAGDGTARAQNDQDYVKRATVARATRSWNLPSGEETLLPCYLMLG